MKGKQLTLIFALAFSSLAITGCESTYYAAMEKVGTHKRDILVSRVEDANESQLDAQEQFQDALTHLTSLINFDGAELAEQYEVSKAHFESSQAAADDVTNRIESIESVADALFEEWQEEIELYSNASLKRQSQQQLRDTQRQYNGVIRAMRKAESRMFPVLEKLQDNVLFLKHNLNAKAIGALQGEYQTIQRDVQALIDDMNAAIAQSNQFIEQIK
ncbi:DUF2959 domain-containing protein [Thalassotalea sp. LPB0316]|uniref:DUF2959 domain-containing protein n=1 Tax=Thalassotalea sp. LPB0316 TaxID=2769490 RepID=UPI0018664623|nr:DUF2959 domain-containing protein [Thalassotalea sp. LPB0316]QOL26015.1 DUF2959 domain-containing protein [Thalassotalea sp. LPB0316]